MLKHVCQPCTQWEPFLAIPEETLHELPLDTRQALAEHLVTCQSCQQARKEFQQLDQLLLKVVQEVGVASVLALMGEDFLAKLQSPAATAHIPQRLKALWKEEEEEESAPRSLMIVEGQRFATSSLSRSGQILRQRDVSAGRSALFHLSERFRRIA